MAVTNRDEGIFVKSYMDWDQLDDEIAVVPVNGRDMFFDPGERYCEFGKLHWKHTFIEGVRQVDGGTTIATSADITYKDSQALRIAELRLDSASKLQGAVRMTYTGSEALEWRQHILRTDEEQAKKDFEEELQKNMPAGVVVKTNHFIGVTDYDHALMVVLDVSGNMGTTTGKRIFLPANFFEANEKPLFAHEKRANAVNLPFPYMVTDSVVLSLPSGFSVESVPKDAQIPLPNFADYVTRYKSTDTTYIYNRRLIIANILYSQKEYPQLKDFYGKVNVQDQQQAILRITADTTKGH